jgi:hypothetical protein
MRVESKVSIAKRFRVFVLALVLIPVIAISVGLLRYFHSFQYVTGTISRHDFLYRLSFYRPIEFINEELRSTDRVMLIGAQMNYGLKRPYYSDESWFATKWRRLLVNNNSLEEVNADLKAQGITHILYGRTLPIFAAQMGLEGTGGMSLIASSEHEGDKRPEYPLLRNWATFTLYKERYLETVYKDRDGYEVLRIK